MGSGACAYSAENDCCTVNLDIGGGTTNIAVFQSGEMVTCGCYDIGGRLICVDKHGALTKVSKAAKQVGQALGLNLSVGLVAPVEDLRAVTDKMAALLVQALGLAPAEPLLNLLITPGSSRLAMPLTKPARICFSGGVADLIYNASDSLFPYSDIGALLGTSVRQSSLYKEISVLQAGETISATVVGAGTYTTSISGSTVSVDASVLPQKNVPVFRLQKKIEEQCIRSGDYHLLQEQLSWFLKQHDSTSLILALEGPKNPEYETLQRLSAVVAEAMDAVLPEREPVLLVIGEDIAMALGLALRRALNGRRKSVVLDGLRPKGESYMDLGQPLADGMVVPVIMKTLIFG
jgi:ethanolamine utilization protein EutA